MKRLIESLALCLVAMIPAEAQPIPSVGSALLIDRGRDYEGKTIVFEGEAIGDPMRRGGHAWINLLDANAAMGIWIESRDLEAIRNYGSYSKRGDRLRITGVFHRACREHGGDMDIHAASIEVESSGGRLPHPADPWELALAPLFLALAALLRSIWKGRASALDRRQEGKPIADPALGDDQGGP